MAQKARNPWLIALILTSVLIIIYSHGARAQGERPESIRASITAQMVQDGIVDNTRLFVFEFAYLAKTKFTPEVCIVRAMTINNILCGAKSFHGTRGFWVKPEFWINEGGCTARPLDKDKRELIVNAVSNPKCNRAA